MSKVYIAPAASYILESEIYPALKKCLQDIDGEALFQKNKKIFVKINHLSSVHPDNAVTTHPVVLEALLKVILENGAIPVVGDDIEISKEGDSGFVVSGIEEVCKRQGVLLLNLKTAGYEKVVIPGAELLKEEYIAKPVLESDCVISLAKLKTHSLTLYTGAVKNMFGAITQGRRRFLHVHHADKSQFATMLVDLFSYGKIKPSLAIMDAVVGMEGEGPQGGKPRKIGYILASKDAVALDAVSSSIIGLEGRVAHINLAGKRGLGTSKISEIEISGISLKQAKQAGFSLPKGIIFGSIPGWMIKAVYTAIAVRPDVIIANCRQCDKCVMHCPTGAIKTGGVPAHIDYKKCIDCLCCQEVCPYYAIDTKQYILGRIIRVILSIIRRLKK